MIDCHCHLNDSTFSGRLEAVISEAASAGVTRMICAGYNTKSSRDAVRIAATFENVYACVGLGYETQRIKFENIEEKLNKLIVGNKIVAVGEAGLNLYRGVGEESEAMQIQLFEAHIRLAKKYSLPLVVHNRNADNLVYDCLTRADFAQPVIMHSFSGDSVWAKKCLGRGWYLSFGGIATFKNSGDIRKVMSDVPIERLLFETDSPYLSPEPIRGKVNTPANVKIMYKLAATVRGCDEFSLEHHVAENARRIFSGLL